MYFKPLNALDASNTSLKGHVSYLFSFAGLMFKSESCRFNLFSSLNRLEDERVSYESTARSTSVRPDQCRAGCADTFAAWSHGGFLSVAADDGLSILCDCSCPVLSRKHCQKKKGMRSTWVLFIFFYCFFRVVWIAISALFQPYPLYLAIMLFLCLTYFLL